MVLIILVIPAVLISVLPSYFKSVSPESDELKKTITFQQIQIDTLNNNLLNQNKKLVDLNRQIISNQQECTDRLVKREKEILMIIGEMKQTVKLREKTIIRDSLILESAPRGILKDDTYQVICDLEDKIKNK